MLRRTGFSRPRYEPEPAAPPRRVELRGVIARVIDVVLAQPKTTAHRNPHLLNMARDQPCMLRLPGVCLGDSSTVACHSNQSCHGKGGARKANDEYTVAGCMACHRWLDQGRADSMDKILAFTLAHDRQVAEWRHIAADELATERDRAAAIWAIERLTP